MCPNSQIRFSSKGNYLAAAFTATGSPTLATLAIYHVHTTAACAVIPSAHVGHVYSLAWSPKDTFLLTASQDTCAIVWHVRNLQTHVYETRRSGGRPEVAAWDGCRGAAVHSVLRHGCHVYAAVFAPAGANHVTAEGCGLVITGGGDGAVRVWDADTGECMSLVEAHVGGVNCCLGMGGGRLLTGGGDGVVRDWRVGTVGALELLRSCGDVKGEAICCM